MTEEGYAGNLDPKEAWRLLAEDPEAVLVDVRTAEEWAFVGVPDLSGLDKEVVFVEWVLHPDRRPNPDFESRLTAKVANKAAPVLFICRSGVRSRHAAVAMTAWGYDRCYNVATGFEGDRDDTGHRGTVAGWKVDGLPWAQE